MTTKYRVDALLTEKEYQELVLALQAHFDITNDMSLEDLWIARDERVTFDHEGMENLRREVGEKMDRVLAIRELLIKLGIPTMS